MKIRDISKGKNRTDGTGPLYCTTAGYTICEALFEESEWGDGNIIDIAQLVKAKVWLLRVNTLLIKFLLGLTIEHTYIVIASKDDWILREKKQINAISHKKEMEFTKIKRARLI